MSLEPINKGYGPHDSKNPGDPNRGDGSDAARERASYGPKDSSNPGDQRRGSEPGDITGPDNYTGAGGPGGDPDLKDGDVGADGTRRVQDLK